MILKRAVAAALLFSGVCTAGIWVEFNEAGRLPPTGQVTTGLGRLATIFGALSNPDPNLTVFDVDLYLLHIFDPLNFSASSVNAPGFYVADPQLFLFTQAGIGVYMNDDDESGLSGSQSRLPAAHALGPAMPGFYFLGIGWWNNEPLSATGPIFSTINGSGTNGRDFGAGGGDPLAGWNDDVLARIDLETFYEITLTGAAYAIPEPSIFLLLGAGLGWLAWRRCRQAGQRRSAADF